MITFKSDVKEMYFISQGIVEVFNNENDEILKEKPILFLPKHSYFGDYQILLSLKSNCEFKTCEEPPEDKKIATNMPSDTTFYCIKNETLLELCDLFPQTAENLKYRAHERRKHFIKLKKNASSCPRVEALESTHKT